MANYPATNDWVDYWKTKTALSIPTDEMKTTGPIEFTIQAEGGNYNGFGTMSMIKQTVGENSKWWWGYSTQINMSIPLANGNTIQQFLYTLGQDVINTEANFINFYCTATRNAKAQG